MSPSMPCLICSSVFDMGSYASTPINGKAGATQVANALAADVFKGGLMHTTDASAAVANEAGSTPIERVYFAWNDALSRNDADGLLKLYAPGAVLESPLVPYLLGTESGVLRGHAQLRPLFQKLRDTKPPVRQYYRTAYLTDGKRLVWEYPRSGPHGEQMDFVEAMELNDHGLIQRHCVYWGWFGVRVLQRHEYHR